MRDGTYERAHRALRNGLHRVRGAIEADGTGLVARLDDNLVDGVPRDAFEADFTASYGPEFEAELRRLQATSALAINCFAPWRSDPGRLALAGETGFSRLGFAKRLGIGPDGAAIMLDALAESPQAIVGVEIRLLEPLRFPEADEVESAWQIATRALADLPDLNAAGRLAQTRPDTYRSILVPELLAQFAGLARSYPEQRKILLYLYWEPPNGSAFMVFRRHRDELDRFAASVAGDAVAFRTQSLGDLWEGWASSSEPDWLRAHARRLIARYLHAM